MVRCSLSLPLLTAAGSLAQKIVPNRYVVEVGQAEDPDAVLRKIDESSATTKMTFDYQLFKGVSIQLNDEKTADSTLAEIQAMPGVRTWHVRQIPRPNPEVLWIGRPEQDFSTIQKRQLAEADMYSTHVQTQVDKLRAEGLTGKGIKVAVIDTGIDYKHPALGGCFGPNCLVAFGTDLVGDAYRGVSKTTPVPDADPMDCGGHGTHVAGIIAAQNNSFGFTGAAPDVTLGAYKVFGCEGPVENDVLIKAFNQAYEDGADIITASIGGASGWSEEPWSVAVERIVEKGVPCTLACGNEGDVGMFYASSAASGKGVLSVGSVDNTVTPSLFISSTSVVDGGNSTEFLWTPGEPAAWADVNLPLWAVSFNTTDPANGCEPYPEDTPDLSGYIVLIRRGTCTFVQKAGNAAAHGAKYVVFYNNVAGAIAVDLTAVPPIKGTGMVGPEVGAAWIKALSAGSEVRLEMVDPNAVEPILVVNSNNSTAGSLSAFTTWGPTWELDVNPLIASPGGRILSTYPQAKGSYAVLSGTSMATPLLAAVVALVGQKRGSLDPTLIENLLVSTASPIQFNYGAPNNSGPISDLAPVPQQGGGLVRAYDAAHATTVMDISHISFNDTDHFVKSTQFTISNLGNKAVTYELGNTPALTANMKANASSIAPMPFPNEFPEDTAAALSFSPPKVTIPAGGKATVSVTATPSDKLDPLLIPVWSGWITVTGDDGKALVLPYQGVTGSMHSLAVIEEAYLTTIDPSTEEQEVFNPAPGNLTFVLPAIGTANFTNATLTNLTYPGIYLRLAVGTILLRADLVPLTTCPPNGTQEVLGAKVLGQHREFPHEFESRVEIGELFDGELSNGKFAPPGKYKWLFRALKIFGDPSKVDEYQTIESVPFRISYAEPRAPGQKLAATKTRRNAFDFSRWW